MKRLQTIILCLALAVSASLAGSVDIETFAKQNGSEFHWFPVQKTFTLLHKADTLKFAVGIPYASSNKETIALTRAPEIKDGRAFPEEPRPHFVAQVLLGGGGGFVPRRRDSMRFPVARKPR